MILRNAFLYLVGLMFLVLAKGQNVLRGYSSPKPFRLTETERCIDYDMQVVDDWLAHLRAYTGGQGGSGVEGRNVLELGPGSDLGVGLYLLGKGAASYSACDVNDLAKKVPAAFYDAFFTRLHQQCGITDSVLNDLRKDLQNSQSDRPSRLNYVVRGDFDLEAALGRDSIDLAFSQAAFEHFDDVEATITKLTSVCKSGAILVAEVDLQTHSRWIREKDPNNIYRYPDWLFNLFWFRGIPNRVRPQFYADALRRHGWQDVQVMPRSQLNDSHLGRSGWARKFRDATSQMTYLTILVCARRG